MTDETDKLQTRDQFLRSLRRLQKATPVPKEEPDHVIGQMVAASRRKGGRRKAQRRGAK